MMAGGLRERGAALCVAPRVIGAVAWLLVACDTAPSALRHDAPVLEHTAVAPNALNVLSAVATVRAQHAESVAVRFHPAGASGMDSVTPVVRVADDSARVLLLGLLPEQRYVVRAVGYGTRTIVATDSVEFTTGALPVDLPHYVADGPDPSPGFVVFAAGKYGVVIDNTGRVVWYRAFPNGVGLSFMAQPTGRYVARPSTPDPADVEPWVEIDSSGTLTRSLGCMGGLVPRLHDLILAPDGSYWILCDETRTMDLTAVGGVATARVTGTVVQHVSAANALLFQWNPVDHFEITDLAASERAGPAVNWTHGNALDLDSQGNLLVSFRSLGEITKIDTRTGAIIWRLGGLRNQFAFLGTSMPAFRRQHGVRSDASGSVLLLDNLGDPSQSLAERYVLDEGAHTARLAISLGDVPGVTTEIGGSVQSLAGSRTLVSFGTAGRVEEYDAGGNVVWRIEGNPGYVFRAQRIKSLYAPGVGTAR